MAAGESAGLTTHGFVKIDEIPYDFRRRRLTIVVAEDGIPTQHLIVTKGAFSNVLDTCSLLERDAADIPLTSELRAELEAVVRAKGQGLPGPGCGDTPGRGEEALRPR